MRELISHEVCCVAGGLTNVQLIDQTCPSINPNGGVWTGLPDGVQYFDDGSFIVTASGYAYSAATDFGWKVKEQVIRSDAPVTFSSTPRLW